MLRGAVTFGEDFEQNYMKEVFALQKGMTQAISHFSRFEDADVASQRDGKYKYGGTVRRNALTKIRKFYYFSIGALCVVGVCLFVATAHFGHSGQLKFSEHPSGNERFRCVASKKLLVCDLDNTLYDWVGYFVPSFYAMVDKVIQITGCDREKLLDDFREVHEKHGDSEQPFALLETQTIKSFYRGSSAQSMMRDPRPCFSCVQFSAQKKI